MSGEIRFPGILMFIGGVVSRYILLMQVRKKLIGVCAPFLASEKARLGISRKAQ